jgi:transketolase
MDTLAINTIRTLAVDAVRQARTLLAQEGIPARAVGMPSWELFEAQPRAYRDAAEHCGFTAERVAEAAIRRGGRTA